MEQHTTADNMIVRVHADPNPDGNFHLAAARAETDQVAVDIIPSRLIYRTKLTTPLGATYIVGGFPVVILDPDSSVHPTTKIKAVATYAVSTSVLFYPKPPQETLLPTFEGWERVVYYKPGLANMCLDDAVEDILRRRMGMEDNQIAPIFVILMDFDIKWLKSHRKK